MAMYSEILSSFNYTYNGAGNRTQVVEADGDVVTWSYGPTYQLTNEQRSGANAYNITYAYDGVGNRTLLLNGGAATTSTYNAANELATSQSSAATTTCTFDSDGNLLTSQAPGNQWTTNTWDGENRLTRVALPSGIVDSFTYNGDGQRVQKQDSTGTTNHVWDGQNILLETNAGNAIQVVYTLEPAGFGYLVSQVRGGTTHLHLFDALGSTTELEAVAGTVSDTYVYDSPGNTISVAGSTANPLRYVGRLGYYYDQDVANYYVRARTYDPATGRFLSRDPAGLRARSDLYTYVQSNFVNARDPSGAGGGVLIPIAFLACVVLEIQTSGQLDAPNDRFQHCYFSCVIARGCSGGVSLLLGIGKELWDEVCKWVPIPRLCTSREGASGADLDADGDGLDCATILSCVPLVGGLAWFWQSCYDCCNKIYPRNLYPGDPGYPGPPNPPRPPSMHRHQAR